MGSGFSDDILLFACLYMYIYLHKTEFALLSYSSVCLHRTYRMVDVLSARLQDLYTKWESRSEPRLVQQANSQILSYGGLRRYGHQERLQKRALAREASREVTSESTLALSVHV